ncbi:hypothetical protein [Clostridium lacusfryxellense]|uniref:hypothetical protein n=1 Tax=Clostridium lacusfryxellense TaxID=205328 RepID=UPI001C0DC60A|nr:hypothetical protein [Clostridium lacusfryxellense]MBU3113381.1 hypothetical protein [Clostridium lacusfryxellense]
MSWCPKCKCEYRTGFIKCSDCGCDLVEVLETTKVDSVEEYDTEAFLISVSDDFEAKLIESKLNAFDIPSLKKTAGINGIYGFPGNCEISIYVPSKLLDNAKDIIDIQIK